MCWQALAVTLENLENKRASSSYLSERKGNLDTVLSKRAFATFVYVQQYVDLSSSRSGGGDRVEAGGRKAEVRRDSGHTYERRAIEQWLRGHDTSPKMNARLESTHLVPAHALRNAIEEWERAHCRMIRRTDITPAVFDRTTLVVWGLADCCAVVKSTCAKRVQVERL